MNLMKTTEKKKFLIIFLTALGIVLLDQILKFLILKNMFLNQSIPLISDIFHLTYIQNTGAGFGILQGNIGLLIWFSIFAIGLILYFYDTIPNNTLIQIAVALILGGTLGNLIDRIRLSYVIDFIDFRIWPAFNIADMAITIGIIGLILYILKKDLVKEKK